MDSSSSTPDQDVTILLVEDNPGDARLLEETFRDASITNAVHVVTNGEEALDFVHQRNEYTNASRPNLILLDWQLPTTSGEEVLDEIKSDPSLEHIPVIVMTGSEAQVDVITSYNSQANAYVPKPLDPYEFIDVVRSLEEFWLSVVRLPPPADEE